MKSLLFGLLFAIRALYQSLSVVLLVPIIYHWKSTILGCRTGYSLINVSVGIITLILFGVCASKDKYRKGDDICHVYKFAEDYIQSRQISFLYTNDNFCILDIHI